jgi:hypothetical protein
MDNLIKAAESETFSTDNIRKLCDSKVRVVSYTSLGDIDSIEDVLGPHKAAVILYETKESFGHWVCLFETAEDPAFLEFFDSYGLPMDAELKFISPHYRNQSGQDVPHLTALVQRSNYKGVMYNKHKLQSTLSNVSTCGRWCGLRLAFRNVPLLRFLRLFENQTQKPDYYAVALSLFVK